MHEKRHNSSNLYPHKPINFNTKTTPFLIAYTIAQMKGVVNIIFNL